MHFNLELAVSKNYSSSSVVDCRLMMGSIPRSTKSSTGELTIEVGTAQTQHRIDGGRIPASTGDLEASPNLFDRRLDCA